MSAPKHVDVTLSFGSNVLVTTSFDPEYKKQSRGASCGGDCSSATDVGTTQ